MEERFGNRAGNEGKILSMYIQRVPGMSDYCVRSCTNLGNCAAMTAALAEKRMNDDASLDFNVERDFAIRVANDCAQERILVGSAPVFLEQTNCRQVVFANVEVLS